MEGEGWVVVGMGQLLGRLQRVAGVRSGFRRTESLDLAGYVG